MASTNTTLVDKSISVVVSCVPIAIAIILGYYSSVLSKQSRQIDVNSSVPRFNMSSSSKESKGTGPMSIFYNNINKPRYAPPPIVFSIVWPILYVSLAIATFLATFWTGSCRALTIYVVLFINLIFNVAYPYAQFVKGDMAASMVVVWGALVTATLFVFAVSYNRSSCTDMFSALFATPYVLWLCFASVLSVDIYILNPKKNGVVK